ncbi:MAG: sugar transferase [Synergistes sp.]|nr:sugar transferase [Synergistes sp.]
MRDKDKTIWLKKLIIFFVRYLNIILVTVSAGFVWNNYYNDYLGKPFHARGNQDWLLLFLYIVFFHIFNRLYSGYRIGSQRLTDIVYSNWLSVCISNILIFIVLVLVTDANKGVSLIFYLNFSEMIILITWAYAANKLYFRLFPPRSVICFYGGSFPSHVLTKIRERPEKFELTEMHPYDAAENIGDMLDKVDGVILYNLSEGDSARIMTLCLKKKLRYYLVPTVGDILLKTSETTYLFDTPLYVAKNEGLRPEQIIMKRVMDIVISVTAILIFMPVMLVIAVLIKLEDWGPVLYKQKRCTQNDRIFTIYKFRSMIVSAEGKNGAQLSVAGDPRVTGVGAFLRRFRLDELPQLFNILAGDMSFVGPRPERPELVADYIKKVPEFALRTRVKSGLTGYAQVMGRYDTSPEEKLKLDLIYIQTYSVLLDIKIILMTIKIVLFNLNERRGKAGAEQVHEEAVRHFP